MPRSSSGKWVARAGATGGGRTYRGQIPINWYAALVLIVILGIGSVVFARYEYQNPKSTTDTVAPTKGTDWYAAMVLDVCGTQLPTLASNEVDPTTQSFLTTGDGVILVSPKKTADAGDNAVLGKFLSGYKGLSVSATALTIPSSVLSTSSTTTTSTTTPSAAATTSSTTTTTTTTTSSTTTTTTAAGSKERSKKTATTSKTKKTSKKSKGSASTPKTYRNGQTCPAGTKDAGKKGVVKAVYWSDAFASKAKPITVTGNPSTIKFSDNQLITVGFVPSGTSLPKPNGTVVTALLDASEGTSTTTTSTTTTAAATTASTTTTSTTAAATATATASTTTSTTAAPSTTTTTSSK